jgi:DNA polymerase-3 subunit chi
MARVDFYVIAAAGEGSRQQFACRLAEKAYRLKHTVHIRLPCREQAEKLDELLWTFRDGSFVPHEMLTDLPAVSPVTIGFETADPRRDGQPELLINLTDGLPQDAEAFTRIAEIVTSDDQCRRRSRKLYADYRAQGHSLESHEL